MTLLTFGIGSRLNCPKCLEETFHGAHGVCCHCGTPYVQASAFQPEFNYFASTKAVHQLRPAKNPRRAGAKSGGRPRVPRPDRSQLRDRVHSSGGMAAAGKFYGVSEKTVHRWLLSYGLMTKDWRKPKTKDVPRGTISRAQEIGVTT